MGVNFNYNEFRVISPSERFRLAVIVSNGYSSSHSILYGLFDEGNKLIKAAHSDLLEGYDYGLGYVKSEITPSSSVTAVQLSWADANFVCHPEHDSTDSDDYILVKNLLTHTTSSHYERKVNKGVATIYPINSGFIGSISDYFTSAETCHLSAALLHCSLKSLYDAVFIHYLETSIQVIYIKNGKLIANNCYIARTVNAKIYFSLLLFHELSINRKLFPLYIAGKIDESDQVYYYLKRYIRNIHFMKCPIQAAGNVEVEFPHYYYGLYCLSECA